MSDSDDNMIMVRLNLDKYEEVKLPIPKYWNAQERHHWTFALFGGCTFLYAARTIMPIGSVAIGEDLHWDKTSMGTALSAFFWGYMMTQFLGGYLSDLIGGEKVLTLAAYGWSIITLVFPFLPSVSSDRAVVFHAFVLARIFQGILQGFHFPAMGSLMPQRVAPKERQFTYSFMSSGAQFGTLLCGSIGSFLLEGYGWRLPFVLIGCGGLIWAFITRYHLLRHSQRVINYSFNVDQVTQAVRRDPIPWGKLLHSSAFWAMLIAHYTYSNSFAILLSWLPSYFHDSFPDAKSWVFNVIPWLVSIPTIIGGGLIGDRLIDNGLSVTFVRKLMTTLVLLGNGILLILMSYTPGYYSSLTCMALAVACTGFHSSGIMLNPQDIAPKFGGAIYGIMSMFGALSGTLGVYMAGYVLDTTKSWTNVFNQTGAVCIIGWIVYMLFGTGKKIV